MGTASLLLNPAITAVVVDVHREAHAASRQRAEIDDLEVQPEDCVQLQRTVVAPADDLATLVEAGGPAECRPGWRAEIGCLAFAPERRVRFAMECGRVAEDAPA